ncbi:hypothetical protein DRP77_03795 [Candidatus Poribacteria bacterium]|nr:MAG: hypothetical protein DRP77_03795 [Candidatus Poribacteria bacterium]
MKYKFADTNLFLRFLTADDREKFERCKELLARVAEGKEHLIVSHLVVAELVWTLLSFYKLPKAEVVEKLLTLLSLPSIHVPDKGAVIESLVLFGSKNVDYVDAYNAVFMRRRGIKEIYSYDRHFDRIEFVERLEP